MLSEHEHGQKAAAVLEGPRTGNPAAQRSYAKNRGRLDTVAEIVNACSGGANKSRVMLVANVNSLIATELLNRLVDSGLVSCTIEGNCVTYHATHEGLSFVHKYSDLVSMLCPGTVPQTRLSGLVGAAESWV